jgi:hypothetical protein
MRELRKDHEIAFAPIQAILQRHLQALRPQGATMAGAMEKLIWPSGASTTSAARTSASAPETRPSPHKHSAQPFSLLPERIAGFLYCHISAGGFLGDSNPLGLRAPHWGKVWGSPIFRAQPSPQVFTSIQ